MASTNHTQREVPSDVFGAAEHFAAFDNSSARALSPELIEWQCRTWGSGRGRAYWADMAVFAIVAEVFGLETSRNVDGRDELLVLVPLAVAPQVAALIDRLEADEPESWPWLGEDDPARQLTVAADVLDLTVDAVQSRPRLLEALQLA